MSALLQLPTGKVGGLDAVESSRLSAAESVRGPTLFCCRLVGRDMGGCCRVTVVGVEECVERLV